MKPQTKTILITGAAKRVGRAVALHLARQGWDVAVHCHASRAEAEMLAGEIRALGRRATVIGADLSDPTAVAGIIPAARAALGPITALINNAAMFEKDTLATLNAASWDAHQRVNFFAPLVLIKNFAAQFDAAPHAPTPCIINFLDGCRGWSMSPDFLSYSASKAGLAWATEFLAVSLAPAVRLNGIALGASLPGHQDGADTFDKIAASTPLQRTSNTGEICAAVTYLLGAESVTGQVVDLGGGLHLRHH